MLIMENFRKYNQEKNKKTSPENTAQVDILFANCQFSSLIELKEIQLSYKDLLYSEASSNNSIMDKLRNIILSMVNFIIKMVFRIVNYFKNGSFSSNSADDAATATKMSNLYKREKNKPTSSKNRSLFSIIKNEIKLTDDILEIIDSEIFKYVSNATISKIMKSVLSNISNIKTDNIEDNIKKFNTKISDIMSSESIEKKLNHYDTSIDNDKYHDDILKIIHTLRGVLMVVSGIVGYMAVVSTDSIRNFIADILPLGVELDKDGIELFKIIARDIFNMSSDNNIIDQNRVDKVIQDIIAKDTLAKELMNNLVDKYTTSLTDKATILTSIENRMSDGFNFISENDSIFGLRCLIYKVTEDVGDVFKSLNKFINLYESLIDPKEMYGVVYKPLLNIYKSKDIKENSLYHAFEICSPVLRYIDYTRLFDETSTFDTIIGDSDLLISHNKSNDMKGLIADTFNKMINM